jgi:hypothetical protein
VNMNPLIINIVVLERELELQRQRHVVRRDCSRPVEPVLRPKRKKLEWILSWIRRRQACESS